MTLYTVGNDVTVTNVVFFRAKGIKRYKKTALHITLQITYLCSKKREENMF